MVRLHSAYAAALESPRLAAAFIGRVLHESTAEAWEALLIVLPQHRRELCYSN